MSGFDFEALRDPDAPQPDSHHRDGVEARAHELRAKARRNRAIVSALALAVVVGAVAGIVATRPDDDQVIVQNPSSTTTAPPPPSSIGDRFVPPTTTEKGITTLPVTLPDGETFTMKYPEQMKIAQLGFAGGIGVNWPVEEGALHCCGKVVSIRYTTVGRVYGDAKPVKVYRGADGSEVQYFHGSQSVDPPISVPLDYLAYQFGPWLVQVYDVQHSGDNERRMTDAQRETWARSLTGTVDANGYLVLHAAAPLSVGNGFDGTFGTQPGNLVEVASHLYCGQPESDTNVRRRFTNTGESGVSWCAGDLHVSASGTKTFVDLAATDLQVSGPITETTTTTTTTTTTPAVSPRNAASASFVSADHGWLVESNGDVLTTTDAGASWRAVGSLGRAAANMKIRFADANRGFAVPTDLADQATTLTTDDGGATWKALDLPFSGRVYDLAISKGTVYAVALESPNFRIWSTPADRFEWKEDSIRIPVGAGPVPVVQLTFSGSGGWLVVVNRTVVAGASTTTDGLPSDTPGQWSEWAPPCLDVNGPARLAASSSRDVVASCHDHEWGGDSPPAAAAYFSRDGGLTFTRHPAPGYGQIAAANPSTAVIADTRTENSVLWRTTDSGASWHEVGRDLNAYSALDLGFTTSTQGFVVFSDGKMMMTYDAGATWSAVTKP